MMLVTVYDIIKQDPCVSLSMLSGKDLLWGKDPYLKWMTVFFKLAWREMWLYELEREDFGMFVISLLFN